MGHAPSFPSGTWPGPPIPCSPWRRRGPGAARNQNKTERKKMKADLANVDHDDLPLGQLLGRQAQCIFGRPGVRQVHRLERHGKVVLHVVVCHDRLAVRIHVPGLFVQLEGATGRQQTNEGRHLRERRGVEETQKQKNPTKQPNLLGEVPDLVRVLALATGAGLLIGLVDEHLDALATARLELARLGNAIKLSDLVLVDGHRQHNPVLLDQHGPRKHTKTLEHNTDRLAILLARFYSRCHDCTDGRDVNKRAADKQKEAAATARPLGTLGCLVSLQDRRGRRPRGF